MRFDRQCSGSSSWNRCRQARWLRMVGLLSLVLIAVQFARHPSLWTRFSRPSDSEASPLAESRPLHKPIRIQRPADGSGLSEDDVYARVDDATPKAKGLEAEVAVTAAVPVAPAAPQWSLPTGTLDGVVDDWFGLTRAEQPALGRLTAYLAGSAGATLSAAADSQVTFEGLLGNPDYYRGQPVTIHGRLRRCTRGRIGHGDTSREVWEAWIVAPDSRNTPYLVYALSTPDQMPTGETLNEAVQVSGVFVRRFAFASRSGEALSALFVSPAIEWSPAVPPVPQRLKQDLQWTTLVFVGLIGGALLGIGGWYLLSDRKFRRSRLHAIGESRLDAAADDLRVLESLDGGDPHRIRIEEPASTADG